MSIAFIKKYVIHPYTYICTKRCYKRIIVNEQIDKSTNPILPTT